MSIDIEVLPGTAVPPSWQQVKACWRDLAGPEFEAEIEAAELSPLGGGAPLAPADSTAREGCFEVRLRTRSTLLLTTIPNAGTFDEATYLDDYGRNLDRAELEHVRARWAAVGRFHQLSSLGGRPRHELALMLALAVALARATAGWVVISHEYVFGVELGVYAADELAPLVSRV